MTDAVAEKAPLPAPLNISSEQYREYVYGDGKLFRVSGPVELYILANGSHRVIDKSGVTHRPERGYVGIRWMPKSGEPAFVA